MKFHANLTIALFVIATQSQIQTTRSEGTWTEFLRRWRWLPEGPIGIRRIGKIIMAAESQSNQSSQCSINKAVMLYKFCIEGDLYVGEHRLILNEFQDEVTTVKKNKCHKLGYHPQPVEAGGFSLFDSKIFSVTSES